MRASFIWGKTRDKESFYRDKTSYIQCLRKIELLTFINYSFSAILVLF